MTKQILFLSFLTQSNSSIQTSTSFWFENFSDLLRKICSSDREKQEQVFERNTFLTFYWRLLHISYIVGTIKMSIGTNNWKVETYRNKSEIDDFHHNLHIYHCKPLITVRKFRQDWFMMPKIHKGLLMCNYSNSDLQQI